MIKQRLSSDLDFVKDMDKTSQKLFNIGSGVDWNVTGDELFITFGKNTATNQAENIPTIKVNSTGQMMIKFKDGQYQYLGAIAGSNHPAGEDTGTTNSTFTIDNDKDANSSTADIRINFGRPAGTGSYASIRSYQGNLEYRNYGGSWTQFGTGGGEEGGHTQGTDQGTTYSTFTIDNDAASNTDTKSLIFGNSTGANLTGIRNYQGTMQFKNYNDGSWSAIGSGTGSGHTQNTDTGTNGASFVIDSGNIYNARVQKLNFSNSSSENEVGIKNNLGTLQYKNAGGSWTDIGGTTGGSFTITNVTGTTQTMVPDNGYIANNNSTIVGFTLPLTAAVGTRIDVIGSGSAGWSITLNTDQQIIFGNASTTLNTDLVWSTHCNDCMSMVCVVANTKWVITNAIGEIDFAPHGLGA